MELSDVWKWYCEQHMPMGARLALEPVSPTQAHELFFAMNGLFSARSDVLKSVPYDTAFDTEADDALLAMAMEDGFATWTSITAGAWRVLYERFLFCSLVLVANIKAGTQVTDRLPSGLGPEHRAKALLLRYLLGHGRAIDRRVLPLSAPGTLPPFPASKPLRPM
jgi:hypothetical protein